MDITEAPFSSILALPLKNGLTRPKAVRGAGVKFVNMGELFANRRIHDIDMDRVIVSPDESGFLLEELDLVFARQSLVLSGAGKCSIFLGHKEPYAFESHLIRARLDKRKADPAYWFYYFESQSGRERIESIVEQVAAAGIRSKDLSNLQVPIPPLPTQKAIAHILGTLDDKIELLRSMNETLEAMARALFKSWFIDFDPVRKKADGQPTGLPPEIDALFPDSFEDSELGEIPKGWSITTLDKIASLETKSIAPYEHPERCFVHYSIPAFDTNGMPNKEYGLSIKSNKYVVRHNAVLLSKLNPETPRIWIPIDTGEDSICSTEFMQFVPRGEIQKYLYLLLGSDSFYDELLKRVTGSTGSRQRAQPSQIAVLPIIKPPRPIVERFEQLASPIIDSANGNKVETSSLTLIRDSLLPKLISGEIELSDKDITKIMEPAK